MRVLFEYPTEFESAKVSEEFKKQRKIKAEAVNKLYLFMVIASILLIVALATSGTISTIFFVAFVISTSIAFFLRKYPTRNSNYVFVTAYEQYIHLVSYDTDLLGRTEAIIDYADIVKTRYKNNTFEILIYETERSKISSYNSKGQLIETSNVLTCKVETGSEFEAFILNIAPTLFG